MKAMVTGGAGFIGSHIVDSLVAVGHEVVAVDNLSAGKLHNLYPRHDNSQNLSFVQMDVCSPQMTYYMDGVDIIFHNAASKKNICLQNPQRDLEVNAGGTLNMLRMAVKYGVKKFIHASTGSVYGEVNGTTTEDSPLNPCSHYGVSKLAGERYACMYSKYLQVAVLRYFHVYGPRQEDGQYGGVVAIFMKNAREGKPLTIYGNGEQVRSFTHVGDIVKINRILAEEDEDFQLQIYNCASGTQTTINQLAGMVLRRAGKEGRVEYADWLEGDIKHFKVDNTAVRTLGVEFLTDLERGLEGL